MANESGSTNEEKISSPVRKKKYLNSFQEHWLEDKKYAAWLEKAEDVYTAKCKVCYKSFKPRKSILDKHRASDIHIFNMQRLESAGSASVDDFNKELKKAEMKYTLEIVEHNRSFYSYKHFVDLSKDDYPNNQLFRKITLKRDKITAIIRNVLSKNILLETSKTLGDKYYSMLLDESTDVSDVKHLCLVLRYVDKGNIQTFLLDLVRVNVANAENLFNCMKYCLHRHNIPLSNLVGFCAGNASVMFGAHNSVVSQLIEDNKEICLFPCICHSLHLVAMHAYHTLPEDIDDFLHNVYNYFCMSAKRQKALQEKQILLQSRQEKMLAPSQTRWLQLFQCIERILNQWSVLYEVFKDASEIRESKKASELFKMFNSKLLKGYLEFLLLPLELFVQFNVLFQKSTFVLHTILPQCITLLRHLGQFFLEPNCLIENDNIHKIDVDNVNNVLPLDRVYVGERALQTLRDLQKQNLQQKEIEIIEFYRNALNFYKIAFKELVRRIPFEVAFLNSLEFLEPEKALQIGHGAEIIYNIVNRFPSKFKAEEVAKEWRLLPTQFNPNERQMCLVMDIPDFWHHVSEIKNPAGDRKMYANLARLAELCLTLPHSNADVERMLSMISNIKAKHRNRLKSETVAALVRIKCDMANKRQNCYTYNITNEMYNLFNCSMYCNERIPENLKGTLLAERDDSSCSEIDEQDDDYKQNM